MNAYKEKLLHLQTQEARKIKCYITETKMDTARKDGFLRAELFDAVQQAMEEGVQNETLIKMENPSNTDESSRDSRGTSEESLRSDIMPNLVPPMIMPTRPMNYGPESKTPSSSESRNASPVPSSSASYVTPVVSPLLSRTTHLSALLSMNPHRVKQTARKYPGGGFRQQVLEKFTSKPTSVTKKATLSAQKNKHAISPFNARLPKVKTPTATIPAASPLSAKIALRNAAAAAQGISIPPRPAWLSENIYSNATGNKVWDRTIECKGCRRGFKHSASVSELAYYVHCVEECPDYKKLDLIQKCQFCEIKGLNVQAIRCHMRTHK